MRNCNHHHSQSHKKGRGAKKLAAGLSATTLLMAMGASAFAAEPATDTTQPETGKSGIWSILTDEQKAQLTSQAKEKLAQELAEGKITQEEYDAKLAAMESGEMPFGGRGGRGGKGMSEEQQAAREAMESQWSALTDAQKEEIYGLTDEKAAIESQIIDKYLELGLIDAQTAATMKENITTQSSEMRSGGKMPMLGRGGKMGGRGAGSTTTSDQ